MTTYIYVYMCIYICMYIYMHIHMYAEPYHHCYMLLVLFEVTMIRSLRPIVRIFLSFGWPKIWISLYTALVKKWEWTQRVGLMVATRRYSSFSPYQHWGVGYDKRYMMVDILEWQHNALTLHHIGFEIPCECSKHWRSWRVDRLSGLKLFLRWLQTENLLLASGMSEELT